MQLEGVTGAPYKHPEVRKAMPKAFARPSITIGGGAAAVKRRWTRVRINELSPGDIVPDVGQIASTDETILSPGEEQTEYSWTVTLTNVFDKTFTFPGHTSVLAYTSTEELA